LQGYALRLPESLKQAAKRIAAADDTTLNQFFVVAIAEKDQSHEDSQIFSAARCRGQRWRCPSGLGQGRLQCRNDRRQMEQ
jgi:hypothetical protein